MSSLIVSVATELVVSELIKLVRSVASEFVPVLDVEFMPLVSELVGGGIPLMSSLIVSVTEPVGMG